MRQRLLERQALLEDVALHDALEELCRQLPARPRTATGEADERGFALPMVVDDFSDPGPMIVKGIAVSGQHRLNFQAANALQRMDVIVQRVRSRLWVQADVRTDLRQQVVARKEHATRRPVEAAMARGMSRRPDDFNLA